ncbi:hypothetical protein C3E79_02840 [Corynebacterium liangguodongii]|uniref:Uncharacterized protein n=2 Tax=Corynebacterium liangguodongii TaxID=2079535 RepID=A0A2S0WCS0_9CORY|nr:hypothetical protein C3E79_02840 [Corynebacterium liangguodongii]PWC00355.1 hypothetical protein DF219_00115 [Corynebacterium liangguodongii]
MPAASVPVPAIVRFGGAVVALQCAAMFVYAISLIATNLRARAGGAASSLQSDSGAANYVGVGTAVFLLVVFGFVAFHAVRTVAGRPSGRGAIVLIEAILLGVAVYMFSGGAPALGAATAASALAALVGVFHPAAVQYWEARYELRRQR